MRRKWCGKLWQAMQRVEMRKNRLTIRAVERAAKRQCKKDERQTKALLAKARDWRAHVFDPLSAESAERGTDKCCTSELAGIEPTLLAPQEQWS